MRSRVTSQPHCLKKTSSMQLKHGDLHETNEKLSFYCLANNSSF